MRKVLLASLAAILMLSTTAASSRAASGTASISLSPGTSPILGSSVSFTTAVPNGTKNPAIRINAYQSGVLVWGYVGGTADSYKLGGDSSPWLTNGGPADITADLVSITWKAGVETTTVLATTSFTAAG